MAERVRTFNELITQQPFLAHALCDGACYVDAFAVEKGYTWWLYWCTGCGQRHRIRQAVENGELCVFPLEDAVLSQAEARLRESIEDTRRAEEDDDAGESCTPR